jgi:hypothetical protein
VNIVKAGLLLAFFVLPQFGCSKKEPESKPLTQAQSATPQAIHADSNSGTTGEFHARPLTSYPERVPPLVMSDWLKRHFPLYIPAQGKAPEGWSELESQIQPEACGKCHTSQYHDWKESLHHKGMGPTVLGQLLDMELDAPFLSMTCQRCHAPLAEQIPYLKKGVRNPDFIEGFREKGLTCAACHVRAHMRNGPPPRRPGAETGGPHGGFTIHEEYESPAFCASCHDFEGAGGMHGKLIQETAQEWRRTEFAAQGITCQKCHMPDRKHLWKGIHDPEMTRNAVSIQLEFAPPEGKSDSLSANLSLTNVGAGHRFPTYIEPQIVLYLEQADAKGQPIADTKVEKYIGRKVTEDMETELFDTRLMPGETFHVDYRKPLDPKAKTLLARVEVWPDEAYRLYFIKMLETPNLRPTMPAVITEMEKAIKLDTDSRYLLWEQRTPL